MHRTLKQETTRPPGMNTLQRQDRFDRFANAFNDERPHEALDMKMPAELYSPSSRRYDGLPDLDYAFQDRDVTVTNCGRICMHREKINVSTALAGQNLGIKKVDDGIWLVSFIRYDLGSIDLEQRTLQTNDNPFGTRLSPMSQGAYSPRMAKRGAGLRLQKSERIHQVSGYVGLFRFSPGYICGYICGYILHTNSLSVNFGMRHHAAAGTRCAGLTRLASAFAQRWSRGRKWGFKAQVIGGCASAGLAIAEPARWRQIPSERLRRRLRAHRSAPTSGPGQMTAFPGSRRLLSMIRDAQAPSRARAAVTPAGKFGFGEKNERARSRAVGGEGDHAKRTLFDDALIGMPTAPVWILDERVVINAPGQDVLKN